MSRSTRWERRSATPSEGHEGRAGDPVARPSSAPASDVDPVEAEFLVRFRRCSELLQQGRAEDAREEIEQALASSPLDPRGRDLQGAIYFRLGLFQNAIQTYESLDEQFGDDVAIKVNLALAYLKAGQAQHARATLSDAVRLNPDHRRAWGYLGLAHQQLGELEAAQVAFERGGHTMMARRAGEEHRRSVAPRAPAPAAAAATEAGLREAAQTAFAELDAGEIRFSVAGSEKPQDRGSWLPREPGQATLSASRTGTQPLFTAVTTSQASVPPVAPHPRGAAAFHREDAPRGSNLPRALLGLLVNRATAIDDAGMLLVRTNREPLRRFAARLDTARVISGSITSRPLHRRTRDAETNESLGGTERPLSCVEGDGQLVLAPRPGRLVALLRLDLGFAFVREDLLFGFDLGLGYENGRVAGYVQGSETGDGDALSMVALRGSGALALELPGTMASLACGAGRPLIVSRGWVVGWLGRLLARSVPPTEGPAGQTGLLSFSGEGSLLVTPG